MGRAVRHDGGHKHDRFLTDTLGEWVEWVPTCPEVEIGLGTPRPAMRLVASAAASRHAASLSRFLSTAQVSVVDGVKGATKDRQWLAACVQFRVLHKQTGLFLGGQLQQECFDALPGITACPAFALPVDQRQ